MNVMSGWPAGYADRLSGVSCDLCAEGRPAETEARIRFFESESCDAYLHLHGVQRGFVTVVWRGSHAVEPTDLSDEEAARFWSDVLSVGRAMRTHFQPLKMNYQLLGNGTPHLHWLVAPRFLDDVAPGRPLPATGYVTFSEDEVRRDAEALRSLLSDDLDNHLPGGKDLSH